MQTSMMPKKAWNMSMEREYTQADGRFLYTS